MILSEFPPSQWWNNTRILGLYGGEEIWR